MNINITEMYSQCGEDKFLNDNYFHNKKNGKYIELGALDGILFSNTKFFESTLNWTGILIEPHPIAFRHLEINRPHNYLFNSLVSCETEELKFRFFCYQHEAISGIEKTLPPQHIDAFNGLQHCNKPQKSVNIKPTTLTDIIKHTPITHFDLLSLDVEGHEYEVLKSWDFSVPIDVILLETLDTTPGKNELCRKILIDNGYKFDTVFKQNEIFILNSFQKK